MKLNTAELLYLPDSEAFRFLPEGPYPICDGRFSWVSIQHGPDATRGSLHIFDLNSGHDEAIVLPGRPGFAFPTDQNNFVVGCERKVGILKPATGEFRVVIDDVDTDCDGTIINDAVTWDGNLIFGTKDLEFKTKKAGLYFWRGRDAKLFRLRSDQICSNGKVIRQVGDGFVDFLDIDSPTRKIVQYRLNTELGCLESEKTVVDLSEDVGVPDGMTSSIDGKSLIVSLYNPTAAAFGRTVQFGMDSGKEEATWQLEGSPQATCPQFVPWKGEACLVITTAVEHMPADRRPESPNAGGIFLVPTHAPMDSATQNRLTPLFREPTLA
jgi:sugar lactone lactonase YvrE